MAAERREDVVDEMKWEGICEGEGRRERKRGDGPSDIEVGSKRRARVMFLTGIYCRSVCGRRRYAESGQEKVGTVGMWEGRRVNKKRLKIKKVDGEEEGTGTIQVQGGGFKIPRSGLDQAWFSLLARHELIGRDG